MNYPFLIPLPFALKMAREATLKALTSRLVFGSVVALSGLKSNDAKAVKDGARAVVEFSRHESLRFHASGTAATGNKEAAAACVAFLASP